MPKTTGSKNAAIMLNMPRSADPTPAQELERCGKGIFIGRSKGYNVPCFLDFDRLINPHIFIVGMTGSGKTYFMRNLMLKLSSAESDVFILDLTGECSAWSMLPTASVQHIDLRDMGDEEKIARATSILDSLVAEMRSSSINYSRRKFILIDEAWKMLQRGKALESIIREGRKYGIGLVFASQTIEDASSEILGNIASVFIFRLQDRDSLSMLGRNYGIGNEQITEIQGLGLGCCFHVALYKQNHREAFFINRIKGIALSPRRTISVNKNMELDIEEERLYETVKEACDGSDAYNATVAILNGGEVGMVPLMERMLSSGVKRHKVLNAMRLLGIPDKDIADAFSIILTKMAERNGKKPQKWL